ncbi:SRPBCC family protein [Pseudotabrizicola alkalilacus]|uniref:SRPBCC family protein n=1 Tax=Pseudotabrizicola alkalilacus TaxID=2305252 RepID=A0A411Z562_9RHOB|nr:SRPBCC family protein [Pseudotabrizicola alkalilacus]RGP38200.1 SRPBCC family protein [Pseudotabrizicola alkalilacus]
MQLSSRTDIEAPVEFVFAALSDFEAWERAAMRRGADVSRIDKLRAPGVGMGWHVIFRFRGKERTVDLRLTGLEPDAKLGFSGAGRMIEGDMSVELLSLSPKRTRLVLHSKVRPLTIAARLFLQSLKLAKGRVQGKLNKRLQDLATDLETRFAASRRR